MLRQELADTQRKDVEDGWEVLVTTYNLAQGDEKDRKFFRKMKWKVSLCHTLGRRDANSAHVIRRVYLMRGTYSRTSNRNVINRW